MPAQESTLPRLQIPRWLNFVVLLVIFGFLAQTLVTGWEQVRAFEWQLDPFRLSTAMLVMILYFVGQGLIWTWSVRRLGIALSFPSGMTMYMTSQLAKYVPGGIWSFANVAVAARQAGLSASLTTLMFALNMVLIVWASVLCAVPVLPVLLPQFPLNPGVLFALLFAASVGFAPFVLRWALRMFVHWRHLPERPEIDHLTSFRTTFILLLVMLVLHLMACFAFFLYFSALVDVSVSEGLFAASAWSASWFVGFIILFVPSGIGVREASLTLFLGSMTSPSVATAIALGHRVFTTVLDLLVLFGLFISQTSRPLWKRISQENSSE